MELQYAQILLAPMFDLYARHMSLRIIYYAAWSNDMIEIGLKCYSLTKHHILKFYLTKII
jgi:hypothetical protein